MAVGVRHLCSWLVTPDIFLDPVQAKPLYIRTTFWGLRHDMADVVTRACPEDTAQALGPLFTLCA